MDEGWPDEQWAFWIDFDSRNLEIMYACSKNGENEGTGRNDFHGTVMKSTDGGAHWFEIINGLNVTQEFYKIIVDKHNPDTIYLAAQNDFVLISYDGGELWEPWTDGLTNKRASSSGNNIANPMVQSADGRYLYFGTFGSGVFRRTTYIPPEPEPELSILVNSPINEAELEKAPFKLNTIVISNGSYVPEASVRFYVNEEYIGTGVTLNDGVASIEIFPPEGTYHWHVFAEKTGYLNATSSKYSFTYSEPEPEQETPGGIPGYPIESIVFSILLASVMLWMTKKKN